ncbi:MAG TPA: hypothetical protein PK733_07785 [Clostridiales bacterium]|nr:hypothetical protein [Clostridiales bacterium]
MLGPWRTHKEYQSYLEENFFQFFKADPKNVMQYKDALSKLYILDLDSLKPLLSSYYSITGAPAKNQPELIRSFILMSELKEHSITNWVLKLQSNEILCNMIGLSRDEIHQVGSYYDLINRVWLSNPEIDYEFEHSLHTFKRKPAKKLEKNKKQPPRHPGIIQKFVDLALEGKIFESRPEMLMQQIFAKIGVEPAAKEGLHGDTEKLCVSGDGTCVNSGASNFGNKVCKCVENGIYNCDCPHKFSDPYARWGWDSYHGQWFYGYTEYILSVYNKELKYDLPLYLRMVQAQRFNGVSAIVALAEARKLYPEFTFDSFCGDSAHDNYATYELLHKLDIKAFIPLNEKNKDNFTYPPHIKVDEHGVPYCMGNPKMINWGYTPDRCRIKYRCPLVLGRIESCDCKNQCSPSEYGRCIYIKPSWDLRLFTVVPRNSDEWREQMKSRITSERVNRRILNDYGLEYSHTRGKKRTF